MSDSYIFYGFKNSNMQAVSPQLFKCVTVATIYMLIEHWGANYFIILQHVSVE